MRDFVNKRRMQYGVRVKRQRNGLERPAPAATISVDAALPHFTAIHRDMMDGTKVVFAAYWTAYRGIYA